MISLFFYPKYQLEISSFKAISLSAYTTFRLPIPVAVRSKAWVCALSLAGIVGSNPAECIDVCLLRVLCVVRYRSRRRPDHSSRGILPSVVCPSVILKPRQWGDPCPLGTVVPWKKERKKERKKVIHYTPLINLFINALFHVHIAIICTFKNQNSSVNIVVSYALDDRWKGFRNLAGRGDVSLPGSIQTESGVYPASCPMAIQD
jgi:hypothetical protein